MLYILSVADDISAVSWNWQIWVWRVFISRMTRSVRIQTKWLHYGIDHLNCCSEKRDMDQLLTSGVAGNKICSNSALKDTWASWLLSCMLLCRTAGRRPSVHSSAVEQHLTWQTWIVEMWCGNCVKLMYLRWGASQTPGNTSIRRMFAGVQAGHIGYYWRWNVFLMVPHLLLSHNILSLNSRCGTCIFTFGSDKKLAETQVVNLGACRHVTGMKT
jgi:hypothetical protein